MFGGIIGQSWPSTSGGHLRLSGMMESNSTYRGPVGFTVAESKMAAGLAIMVLLVSLIVVYQRLVRPTPQYSVLTHVVATAKESALPQATLSGPVTAEEEAPPPVAKGGLLQLNSADYAELVRLPGIGPVLAGRIMDYRDRHGPFFTIDSLLNVPGIGKVKLEKIRPLLDLR